MWTTGFVARSLPAFQGWASPIQEQRSPASYGFTDGSIAGAPWCLLVREPR